MLLPRCLGLLRPTLSRDWPPPVRLWPSAGAGGSHGERRRSQKERPMRTPTPALAFALALSTLPAHAKDPALGATTFTVYEAFLSPAQEPGEESEVPKPLEKSLGATAPSTLRENRKSRGHG